VAVPPPAVPSRYVLPRWSVILIATTAVLTGLALPWLPSARQSLTHSPTAAVPTVPQASSEPTESDNALDGLFGRLYLVAGVLVVLVVGGLILSRRWLPGGIRPTNPADLQLLGAVRINSRCRIFLIQARGRRLLAGLDQAGLQQLVDVPDYASDDARRRIEEPARTPAHQPI